MQIRLLDVADLKQAKDLANYAFDEKSFADWFFDKYVQPSQLVGNFAEQEQLKCMLCLSPYKLRLGSVELDTEYITTVTTSPDSRGKGYFKPLLKYTFEHLRAKGNSFAILKAIESKLYSPFGFAFCYSHLRYSMQIKELEYFSKDPRLELLSVADYRPYIGRLQALYAELIADRYHAASIRSEQNWLNLLHAHTMDGGHIMLAIHDGKPVGYMLYYLRNNCFEIFEMAATTAAVQAHFLSAAYQHRTQVKNFFWRTFADNTAYLQMNIGQYHDSAYPQLAPFMMVRIVDVRRLLSALTPNNDVSLRLQITDDFLEFNNCTLQITATGKQLTIAHSDSPADVCVDIATLAQLVFGAYSVSELLFDNKIQLYNAACVDALNKLFVKKVNFINEEF